jgi:hypothetical protein
MQVSNARQQFIDYITTTPLWTYWCKMLFRGISMEEIDTRARKSLFQCNEDGTFNTQEIEEVFQEWSENPTKFQEEGIHEYL